MNVAKGILSVLLAVVCFFVLESSVNAEEKFEFKQSTVIREALTDNIGKRVSVRLEAGEELSGTVTRVGDQLVHISRLSGREFYDAVIRIDRINAVIFKAREK